MKRYSVWSFLRYEKIKKCGEKNKKNKKLKRKEKGKLSRPVTRQAKGHNCKKSNGRSLWPIRGDWPLRDRRSHYSKTGDCWPKYVPRTVHRFAKKWQTHAEKHIALRNCQRSSTPKATADWNNLPGEAASAATLGFLQYPLPWSIPQPASFFPASLRDTPGHSRSALIP